MTDIVNTEKNVIDTVILSEEFRLIEKDYSQVSLKWKGAHLLLFVLAFIFGAMCTFCLNALAYMFERRCVLSPRLLSLDATKHMFILDFMPKDDADSDFDFLSIQWSEESVCSLPTFVPICSAIFGLIWTTMFLMCSTANETHSLQRPWRLMLPVFVFSLAMGGLCVHVSAATHEGLQQLCYTIGKFTGSEDCSYIMNVATLPYAGRIRGVYQAVRLTIYTAWLHTGCWLLAAALALLRVLLVVDFQMVRIRTELRGDVDAMLERYEKQLRSETLQSGIAFDNVRRRWIRINLPDDSPIDTSKNNSNTNKDNYEAHKDEISSSQETDVIFMSYTSPRQSPAATPSEESIELNDLVIYFKIKRMLNELVDSISLRQSSVELNQQNLETPSVSTLVPLKDPNNIFTHLGAEKQISSTTDHEEGTSKGLGPEMQRLIRLDSDRHVSFTITRNPDKVGENDIREKQSNLGSLTSLEKRANRAKQTTNTHNRTDTPQSTQENATAVNPGDDDPYNASTESVYEPEKGKTKKFIHKKKD